MKKHFHIIGCILLAGVMLFSLIGCSKESNSTGGGGGGANTETAPVLTSTTDTSLASINRDNMLGFCELPTEFGGGATEPETTMEYVANTCKAFGAKSFRVWMHHKMVFTRDANSDEITFKEDVVANFHKYFRLLTEAGVTQILVMNHQFILPWDFYDQTAQCVPNPWGGEYEYYVRTLAIYEKAYIMLQTEFPEITYWEVGNEFEAVQFLHKGGWKSGSSANTYTLDEVAHITADLSWYANRGLKSVNPASVTVFPGSSAQTKVPLFIRTVYSKIAESKSVPTGEPFYDPDPDHYFQIMAWHPYAHKNTDKIMNQSDEIYSIMQEYGDGDKKVWFTELGFSNSEHDDDETMLEKYKYYLDEIAKRPYVETLFIFRITNLWNFKDNELETNYGVMYAQADPVNRGKPKYQALAIYRWFYGEEVDTTPLYWYYNKVTQGE